MKLIIIIIKIYIKIISTNILNYLKTNNKNIIYEIYKKYLKAIDDFASEFFKKYDLAVDIEDKGESHNYMLKKASTKTAKQEGFLDIFKKKQLRMMKN